MNRYRWTPLLALLAPLGLVAWFLLSSSQPRLPPKPVPAAIPAPLQPSPPPSDSSDDDLIA